MEPRRSARERPADIATPPGGPGSAGRPGISAYFRARRLAQARADEPPAAGPAAVVRELAGIRGSTHACVAHLRGGRVLAEAGPDDAGAVTAEAVLAWSRLVIGSSGAVPGHELDDIMITTTHSHHLVRQLTGPEGSGSVLLYVCLDRHRSTLAAARRELASPHLSEQLRTARVPVTADTAPVNGPAPTTPAPTTPTTPAPTTAAPTTAAPVLPPVPPGAEPAPAPALPGVPPADSPTTATPSTPLPAAATAPRPTPPLPTAPPTPHRRAEPAADKQSRRCTPKRTPSAERRLPRPVPAPADAPPVLQQRWADDPDTMSRLVKALRRIAS